MKKLIIITLFFFSLTGTIVTIPFARLAARQVYAVSPTPTQVQSGPTKAETKKDEESLKEKISQLKDRIASRVTELKLVEKKGVIGTVKEASETKIKLEDVGGKTQFIDVDEITKFSSPAAAGTKETFGISDIKKGTTVSVLGLYNKDSKRILARFINAVRLPTFTKGTISKIDKKNFAITVKKENKKEIIVDVENSTTIVQVSREGEMVRSSFSKLTTDDIVHIVAYPDKKEEDRFSGIRILVLSALLETEKNQTTPQPTTKKTISPTRSRPTSTPTPIKSTPTPAE